MNFNSTFKKYLIKIFTDRFNLLLINFSNKSHYYLHGTECCSQQTSFPILKTRNDPGKTGIYVHITLVVLGLHDKVSFLRHICPCDKMLWSIFSPKLHYL